MASGPGSVRASTRANRQIRTSCEDRSGLRQEMLRCAQHDSAVTPATSPVVTLSEAKGLSRWAERCFAALSMTGLCLTAGPSPRAAAPPG